MNPRRSLLAFTLTELLVVISILVILLAVAVPAFTTLASNSQRSLAENQLRVALTAARDAAIRSEDGDAAAYFRFEPGGRITVVPCVVAGRLLDQEYDGANATPDLVLRDVFAPLNTVEPVQLPRGWSVRAYTPPASISDSNADPNGWYENLTTLSNEGNWVFPETHFVGLGGAAEERGVQRHGFIVRFKQGSGVLDVADRSSALVLDPVPADEFRDDSPFDVARADQAGDLLGFARRALIRPDLTIAERRELLGDLSVDTVLVRPVTEMALYQEAKMLAALGTRPNRVTGTIFAPPSDTAVSAVFDPALLPQGVDAEQMQQNINAWLVGEFGLGGDIVVSDARIFIVQRFLGQMQEITP